MMKKLTISAAVMAALLAGCGEKDTQVASVADASSKPATAETSTAENNKQMQVNPFFKEYDTPFGIPPFDAIKNEHFLPAFEKAIAEQKAEIASIVNQRSEPTFENTIEALEYSGQLLTKVSNVFFNLTSANTDEELQAISKEVSPKLSSLQDDVMLNARLFERVSSVYERRKDLELRKDQMKLLEDTYKGFVRGGANLNEEQKSQLRKLNEQLTELSIEFGDNLLAETNNFELVVEDKSRLAGLPDDIIQAAAETAKKRGHEGKWVFTTHRPSSTPLLTYAEDRELREKIFKGYTQRGDNDNTADNKKIAAKMAALRAERAQLMGYKTHADFVLEERTAKSAENVYKLLDKVWPAALKRAEMEVADMQKMAKTEGKDITIEAWDWWYYAEKIRKAKYDFDEAETKPYFSLENTIDGMFYTANKLFGLTFKERTDLPVYHEDVSTYEVYDENNELLGIYLADPYVRDGKRGGAWMNAYRKQHVTKDGEYVKPIIVNVMNYPRPVDGQPTLLTFDQANTLFHEFGHALHGLLSDGHYPSQTGTSVPRDYVEFPSQVMENWMSQPEVLAQFAKHYKTGEVIPESLINKIQSAGQFNQGFATTEYLAAALLDLAWHTQTDTKVRDADAFEEKTLGDLGLIDEIAPRYRTTYFAHIFSGGYSAGYYSYIWSEILDADAFQAFKENGIFDEKTAKAFRDNILSTGGTDDPMAMYVKFRGKEPDSKYLLERRGLTFEK